jgi:Ca2+-binding EF-hand superfamily protein
MKMFKIIGAQHCIKKQGLLIIALLSVPAFSSAQTMFDQADRDGNGTIDYEEFREHMNDVFYHADDNRDGVLAGDELDIMNKARIPASDSNGDSELELREFLNSTGADFHSADKNRDNLISEDEL